MPTEADTCPKFVVPLLQKAGWDNEPHSLDEQRFFTPGRIVSHGSTAWRRPGKRADYLLRYTAEKVPTLCTGLEDLRARWAGVTVRPAIIEQFKKHQPAFFNYFWPEAQEILNDLLETYAADGEIQFTLPDVIKVPPISGRGNVNEITGNFAGPERLCCAVNQLQSPQYAR